MEESLRFIQSSYGFEVAAGTLAVVVLAFFAIILCLLVYIGNMKYILCAIPACAAWLFVFIGVLGLRAFELTWRSYVPGEYPLIDLMGKLPAEAYVIISVAVMILQVGAMAFIARYISTHISRSSIPEALNNLKEGYRVVNPDGSVLLENRVMKTIGESVDIDAVADGEVAELPQGEKREISVRRLGDDSGCTETVARDVTELVYETELLSAKNSELVRIKKQLDRTLLEETEAERERERLEVKIRIHERFGQTLLNGQMSLSEGTAERNEAVLMWDKTLKDFADTFTEFNDETGDLEELCENLGCEVRFDFEIGEAPETLIFAVREAVINAVRHAGADEVYVSREQAGGYLQRTRYVIVSNGRTDVEEISEGGGLSSIRKRVESEGGRFGVYVDGSVRLEIEL